jgi:hypothetical protein
MHFEEPTFIIAVIAAGHVMVGKGQGGADGTLRIYDGRIVERWGTTKGLGELYAGPTSETRLAAVVPLTFVPIAQVIYAFPIEENKNWYR